MLELNQIKNIVALRKKSMHISQENSKSILGLSIDLVTSLCITQQELGESRGLKEGEIIDLNEIGKVKVNDDILLKLL